MEPGSHKTASRVCFSISISFFLSFATFKLFSSYAQGQFYFFLLNTHSLVHTHTYTVTQTQNSQKVLLLILLFLPHTILNQLPILVFFLLFLAALPGKALEIVSASAAAARECARTMLEIVWRTRLQSA